MDNLVNEKNTDWTIENAIEYNDSCGNKIAFMVNGSFKVLLNDETNSSWNQDIEEKIVNDFKTIVVDYYQKAKYSPGQISIYKELTKEEIKTEFNSKNDNYKIDTITDLVANFDGLTSSEVYYESEKCPSNIVKPSEVGEEVKSNNVMLITCLSTLLLAIVVVLVIFLKKKKNN